MGATRQVTGSMYLLELEDGYKILIDCGIDMDRTRERKIQDSQKNHSIFPFEPAQINLVLLTHAHIDHSGNLPLLYKEGYEGQVLCTLPTYHLTNLLLLDSASLHERRLNKASSKKRRRSKTSHAKLQNDPEIYLEKNVKETISQFVAVGFNNPFKVNKNLTVTFNPAGHLLGAASIVLSINEGDGKRKSICFSGDVGRWDFPLLNDPKPLPQVDYLICESTYGNRLHTETRPPEDVLEDVIQRTCIEKAGRLIIPSFSVGRTQGLLYVLNKLYAQKRLKPIKVFVDTPMGIESTKIHEQMKSYLNKEAKEFFEDNDELFDFENLILVEKAAKSREITNHTEPCVIIAASGMIDGGRVTYHVAKNIENDYCTIFMIGYAAEGTLGHELLNGRKEINIDTKKYTVRAKIEHNDVFSGHADQNDLVRFVKSQNPTTLKGIFLVHGDEQSMFGFKEVLEKNHYNNVEIPEYMQTFDL